MKSETAVLWVSGVLSAVIALRAAAGLAPENSLKKVLRILFGGVLALTLLAPLPEVFRTVRVTEEGKKAPICESESIRKQVQDGLCRAAADRLKMKLSEEGYPVAGVRVICRENSKKQWEIAEVTVSAEQNRAGITEVIRRETGLRPKFGPV